ncbi:MAG TPA: phenylalanine--tRNA ligase subunit beta [Candidatus Binatia bacterium]|nr:phenylalanine--tRNA ligase subunit beta [Candidatus Binatia bacterium]
MLLPLAWLKEYVELDASTDEIVAKLATLGFPVDSVERRPQCSGVVVGKLVKVEKHPNADRLQICTVEIGESRPLVIATAAANVAQGQVVPVAKIGAQLVGLKIEARKMRGIDSQGMLVSANELGFDAEWFEDGILILEDDAPIGADFIAHAGLNDDVIDVEITANRVDAMCLIGIARELAVAFKAALRLPETAIEHYAGDSSDVTVRLESPDCKHFVAQRVDGLAVRPATATMRLRLTLAGQRPINNLVDISNYVMLETGQPLHFYDVTKLAERTIVVRDAREGEVIRTLDGEQRTLSPKILVIADGKGAQGIAGIMGGATSEVDGRTASILIEAATFDGPRVRRGGIALGLRTDASARHEKGLPIALAELGAARAARLLASEGGAVQAPRKYGQDVPAPRTVQLPKSEVTRLLGVTISDREVDEALTRLGFFVNSEGAAYTIAIPLWRDDVKMEADVVEEIARAVGYERIEAVVPHIAVTEIPSDAYDLEGRIARAAAAAYREIVTFALQPAAIRTKYENAGVALPRKPLEIANPLSEDQRFMRFSIVPAILELAARELHELPLRVFELGHVFGDAQPAPDEIAMLAWALVAGPRSEPVWHDTDFLTFKGEAEAIVREVTGMMPQSVAAECAELHPGKTAALQIDGRAVALIGALDPRLIAAFGVEANVYAGFMPLAGVPAHRLPKYVSPSRFPGVTRDLALLVAPAVTAADVETAIRATLDGIARKVRVFDEYRGPQIAADKKSLAVSLLLQRDDATMTDAEADARIQAVLDALKEKLGATIRS